jgi:hypothetical protein
MPKLNAHLMKQYAEAGVKVRLREIQEELNMLYREFPHLVGNHDGSLPAVAPLEKKPTKSAGRGVVKYTPEVIEQIRQIIKAHPGIRTTEIYTKVGKMGKLSALRTAIQKTGAVTKETGPRTERTWRLKG